MVKAIPIKESYNPDMLARPPNWFDFSKTVTWLPANDNFVAKDIPINPAPIIPIFIY